MGLQSLKFWHWTLISIVIGALLGYLNQGYDPPPDLKSLPITTFEEDLIKPPEKIKDTTVQWVSNIVVYPLSLPDKNGKRAQYLTCRYVEPRTLDQTLDANTPKGKLVAENYWVEAPVPFVSAGARRPPKAYPNLPLPGMKIYIGKPGDTLRSVVETQYGEWTFEGQQAISYANEDLSSTDGVRNGRKIIPGRAYYIPWSPKSNHTVRDFIDDAAKDHPWVTYRYAWWKEPQRAMTYWLGGSVAILGLAFPTLLWAIGPKKAKEEDDYDLSRFGRGKVGKKPAPVAGVTEQDMQELAAMEASLLESLKADPGQPTAAPADHVEEQPIKDLTAVAADAAAAPKPDEDADKIYGGEYYPVVKQVVPHKKTDDPPPPAKEA